MWFHTDFAGDTVHKLIFAAAVAAAALVAMAGSPSAQETAPVIEKHVK
jgi:hypothetical protein